MNIRPHTNVSESQPAILLQSKLTDSITLEDKIAALSQFKGHVKKELVNAKAIPSYFKTLLDTLSTSNDTKLTVLAHSCLVYLIKRVAMQSPQFFTKKSIMHILYHLIHSIPQDKQYWATTIRAIETIFLVEPTLTEDSLKDMLVNTHLEYGSTDRNKVLLAIDELIRIHQKNNRNPMQILQNFAPVFQEICNTNVLVEKSKLTLKITRDILKKYYNEDLLNEFVSSLQDDDIKNLFLAPTRPTDAQFDVQYEIDLILRTDVRPHSVSTPDSTKPKNYQSAALLQNDLTSILEDFSSPKETEQNWKNRQSAIDKLRNILHGNLPRENPTAFITACKEVQLVECISKAILSLRTTLSVNACQFIREFCTILNYSIDQPVADQIFQVLKTLLSNTKKIASQNAFHCLVILVSNTHFYQKLFQHSYMLTNEKTVLPRICSSILLRLFLIQSSSKLENLTIYIEEWLRKGISDAQTSVRESMRQTFWYFYKCYPTNAKRMLNSTFTSKLKKAIELSIPTHLHLDYQPTTAASSVIPSISSSRRSSIIDNYKRNFPSYAQPTRSSAKNLRSTSEFTLRQTDSNSIDSPGSQDYNSTLRTNRKVSAPATLTKKATDLDVQLDLTGEITTNHSHSLLKKYMTKDENTTAESNQEKERGKTNNDLEKLYNKLNTSNTSRDNKEVIQLLQKQLLLGATVDYNKLVPRLHELMTKNGKDLEPLLKIPDFYKMIPLNYVVELYAINSLEIKELLTNFSSRELMRPLFVVVSSMISSLDDLDETYNKSGISLYHLKYRRTILDYCMNLFILIAKDTEIFDDETLRYSLKALIEANGSDFDESLYYDCLYRCYSIDRDVFVAVLRDINLVSTKLKIYHEVRNRGAQLDINSIFDNTHASTLTSMNMSEKEKDSNSLSDEDDLDYGNAPYDKKYMEMTMINPFKEKRTTSDGSVVHHKPDASDGRIDNENVSFDDEGQTKSKYSEMTKIVSVYQTSGSSLSPIKEKSNHIVKQEEPPDSKFGLKEIFNSKISDVKIEKENFETEKEHTVKFSIDPPSVINDSGRIKTEDNNDSLSTESNVGEEKSPSGLNILSYFAQDSLTHLEITNTANLKLAIDFVPFFEKCKKSINKIKSGSFTIKHLNYILGCLVTFPEQGELLNWLKYEQGLQDLLELTEMLVQSTDEAELVPVHMTCKSIVIAELLIVFNKHLKKPIPFASPVFRGMWSNIIALVSKLSEFENDIYILAREFSEVLASSHFYTRKDITGMLTKLATGGFGNSKEIQEVFYLQTISMILRTAQIELKPIQLSEVVQTMLFYIDCDIVELRYESTTVLAEVYKILKQSPDKQLQALIPPTTLEIINLMLPSP